MMATIRRTLAALLLVTLGCFVGQEVDTSPAQQAKQQPDQEPAFVPLPDTAGSLKFAAFGDFGDDHASQYQTAAQLERTHELFRFVLVVTLGDNLYGSETPEDFKTKFEIPYKPLLDSGVKFYASLGNHDSRDEKNYKLFNMNGRTYYSFKAPAQDVRFFILETSYMDPPQLEWVDSALRTSTETWKIVVFHEPIYSSGGTHGSNLAFRKALEPMFIKYRVSVVLSGHDHIYQRVKPQHGITYFVVGSGGELRRGDLLPSSLTAAGFDTDNAFLVAEIIDQSMYFNAISRTGQIVDSGIIKAREAPK